jgi:hypothetical protein
MMEAKTAACCVALALASVLACSTEEPVTRAEAAQMEAGLKAGAWASRGLTSAREAYELVVTVAEQWSADAALQRIEGRRMSWKGDDMGRCYEWSFAFVDNSEAMGPGEVRTWLVSGGRVRDMDSGETAAVVGSRITSEWIDSSEAMQAFRDNLGASFMKRHPEAMIDIRLRQAGGDLDPEWMVSATALLGAVQGERSRQVRCSVTINGEDGTVDTAPNPGVLDAGSDTALLLTAREAFEAAREQALEWRADVRLISLVGVATAGSEPEGGCPLWSATFNSPTAGRNYELQLLGGLVINGVERKALPPAGSGASELVRVKGEWPDSPKMLTRLKRLGDYTDFVAICPEHYLQFMLAGDADSVEGDYLWSVTPQTAGVTLVAVVARGS